MPSIMMQCWILHQSGCYYSPYAYFVYKCSHNPILEKLHKHHKISQDALYIIPWNKEAFEGHIAQTTLSQMVTNTSLSQSIILLTKHSSHHHLGEENENH